MTAVNPLEACEAVDDRTCWAPVEPTLTEIHNGRGSIGRKRHFRRARRERRGMRARRGA